MLHNVRQIAVFALVLCACTWGKKQWDDVTGDNTYKSKTGKYESETGKHIAIIDDSPSCRIATVQATIGLDPHLHTYPTAAIFFSEVDEYNFVLAITDLIMDDCDGRCVLRFTQGRSPPIPTIVITAADVDGGLEAELRALGAGAVVQKCELHQMIRRLRSEIKRLL